MVRKKSWMEEWLRLVDQQPNHIQKRFEKKCILLNVWMMSACLDPRNGSSLTGITDVTAHSVSLFQKNNLRISMTYLSFKQVFKIAEPIDVQIGELGDKSILNYMNESLFSAKIPSYKRTSLSHKPRNTTYTKCIELIHIILEITCTPMDIITIKNNIVTNNITNDIGKQKHHLIMKVY